MPDPSPQLTVIVVAYRSRGDLERCLPTIYAQGMPPESLELIIVDNGPDDGTRAWLAHHYPTARYLANPSNNGYAGGNNLGLRYARSPWVLILNPDTELLPGALKALLAAGEAHPDALLNPKLLTPAGTLNARGNQMHYTGITSCRDLGGDPERYHGIDAAPLLSGSAILARRETLAALGGFDEAYFMYHEDTDLSLRARLQGRQLLCVDDAAVIHHYTLAMSPQKFYYLERNRLLTLLKNLQAQSLLQLAPALLLTELATWAYAAMKGWPYLSARARGYAWLWRRRHSWRAERRRLQQQRKLPDLVLLREASATLPFDQLIDSARLARWLTRLTRPLYQLLRPRAGGSSKSSRTSRA